MDYAFDTNTVIHIMRGTSSVWENREKARKSGARFILPPFVHTVNDADIVIAAFSIVNSYTLVTNNTKDFENIEGLQLMDWVK